jgi:lysophospholipase L1-like esterase
LAVGAQAPDPDPTRFSEEIAAFEAWDAKNAIPPEPVVFVGSSSMRLWNTGERFPDLPVVNRGFGGSHISDVNHFLDETVLRYDPSLVVFYAGDNDVAADKTAEQILEDYREFVGAVLAANPAAEIAFIPIKPSIARWSMWPRTVEANAMIRAFSDSRDELHYVDLVTPMLGDDATPRAELFVEDGLHMTSVGYDGWSERLSAFLDSVR